MDLVEHLERQMAWSLVTFGPGDRIEGVIDHLKEELVEVEDTNGKDVYEWIDVVILAFDGAWRAGFTPTEIADALAAKQERNENRVWPDWRTQDPNKKIKAVKFEDETTNTVHQ